MRIAVYSGSFNPMHVGHLAVLRALSSCGGFDCTYVVVSPQSPFKGAGNLVSAGERFANVKRVLASNPDLKARAEDIELTMPAPQYTIRTLDALRGREPLNEFTLAIGADNLDSMCRWKDYERILLEYGVIVYPREGYDAEALRMHYLKENPGYRISVIGAETVNISSSEIREAASCGRDMSEFLP